MAPTTLLVTVVVDIPPDQCDLVEIQARLAKLSGWLRSEVAGAITRKRAPLLMFQVLRSQSAPPDESAEESR